ncbi:MAG: beta-lactamase family protein [Gemmatimonadota bacterium]|nr:beta-lactamase family protein [Gemmatimonadota bacterium]
MNLRFACASRSALALLVVCVAAAGPQGLRAQVPWPTDGWAVASPESQGLNRSPLSALDREIRAGTYGHIDRLVIVRNGYRVVSERYARDYGTVSRGARDPLGCGSDACMAAAEVHEFNYYHPDFHPYYRGRDVHTLQSVTKSVTSALIGIAIRRGEITGTSASLLSFFGDYDLSHVDPRLRRATLDDLLTMRTGLEWHETDRPLDSTNTTLQLELSPDWIQFTLTQPMDADPGTKWAYNSGGSHLMSGIIHRATGQTVDRYAETHLFGPLGIRDYHWKRTPTGLPDTEGGLYLEAEQLAKIGYLYLRDGVWNGRRILPEGWVQASTARRVDRVGIRNWGYGYQWWRLDRDGEEVWAGLGFGGQYLLILPEDQVVAVLNSWNVFGGRYPSVLDAVLDAVLTALSTGR